ncbi:hypothetical protein ACFL12_06010 [Pseudomonadota bacterium]
MADLTRVSTPAVTPSTQGGSKARAPKGYAFADEVARRANVMADGEHPGNQASLKRLKMALESDQPLRGDVPRGFYLDLRV